MPTAAEAPRTDPRQAAKDGDHDAIIQVKNFSAAYSGKTVLKDVNFDVHRGEVLIIAGDSGSGKSTVLKHMIGLQHPASGNILYDGEDLYAAEPGPDRDKILRKFGVSFQGGALFGGMTVLENVKLPLTEFAGLRGRQADAVALTKLHMVGLADSAQKVPSELSGGMQKRAAIARAIALDPQIVFMDEPSAGLDPITSAELDQLIKSLNQLLGMTFVIVSHELASILNIASRVLLFSGKQHTLVAEGDPRTMGKNNKDPWVRAFFNRDTPEQEQGKTPTGKMPDAASAGNPPASAEHPASGRTPDSGKNSDPGKTPDSGGKPDPRQGDHP